MTLQTKLVITGSQFEFADYLRRHSKYSHAKAIVHLTHPDQLIGLRPFDTFIAYVGKYVHSPMYGSKQLRGFVQDGATETWE